MVITVAVIGVVAVRLAGEPLVRSAVQPDVLLFLLVVNGALLILRTVSAVDAYQASVDALSARRAADHRPLAAGVALTLLLIATAAPHVAVAYYGMSTHDLLTTVFVDGSPPGPFAAPDTIPRTDAPTTTTAPARPATTLPATIATLPALPTMSDPSVADPPAITPFTAQHDRITVLLIGGDAGPGRGGMRTDTMVVATMEPSTGSAALFSIPRNFGAVPLPRTIAGAFEGGVFDYRLNHLYSWAVDHPWHYPEANDPGAVALMETLSGLLGLAIDYYAVVDLGGFVDLIDALGGIDLYVPEPILDRTSPARPGDDWTRIDLEVGYQHLTGEEALTYARSRSASSDYARMDRQRCLLGALAEQSDPLELAVRIPALVPVLKDVVSTNIPLGHLPDLAEAAAGFDLGDITSVRFIPPTYTYGHDEYGHPIPRVQRIRDTVQSVLDGSYDAERRLSPTDLATACGP
jgi:LCP family protein required for cell wall assembly